MRKGSEYEIFEDLDPFWPRPNFSLNLCPRARSTFTSSTGRAKWEPAPTPTNSPAPPSRHPLQPQVLSTAAGVIALGPRSLVVHERINNGAVCGTCPASRWGRWDRWSSWREAKDDIAAGEGRRRASRPETMEPLLHRWFETVRRQLPPKLHRQQIVSGSFPLTRSVSSHRRFPQKLVVASPSRDLKNWRSIS